MSIQHFKSVVLMEVVLLISLIRGRPFFFKPAGLILQWQCNEGVHGSVDVEVNVGYQAIDDNHGQAAKRHCQQQDERRFAAYQGTRSVHQRL